MHKAGLRELYTEKRRALTEETLRTDSEALAGRLISWLGHRPVHVLHTYLPAYGKREIDTFLILNRLRVANPQLRIAVPRMTPGTRRLRHYFYTPQTPLVANRYGIPEPDPQAAEELSVTQIDMVLVPLLAFDENGYRVGYGGGFYDIFLEACGPSVVKAGLSLFPPVAAIDDIRPFDIRLDLCFTPGKTWAW